jgi:hypothetical protein
MSFFANTEAQQPGEKRKLANISDDAINSNQQSVPVKYLAGRAYVSGDYISPAYNPQAVPIKTQTGKGESQTTGYKYFADFALLFCMGGRRPVDAIYSIIVDSDIVWTGNVQRGNANYETITVPDHGVIRLYWGGETQPIDSVLLTARGTAGGGVDPQDDTTWPANSGSPSFGGLKAGDPNPYSGHYDRHPAYRGQCYAVFKGWKLGRGRTSVPNIQFELKRGCPWFGGASKTSDDKGVNPIAILFDWYTDTRFGMEVPEALLPQTNWIAEFTALEALGARLSLVISEQSDFRQVVAEMLEYYDGWIRRNGSLIEVGHWKHGTPVSSATLTDDDLLGEPELQPQGWGPTLNEVTVVYNDRDHHFNTYSQKATDPNNRRITGSPRPITLQRPWLTDAALAKQLATEYCKIRSLPYCAGALHVKREWLTGHSMLPGKVFTYNSGFYGLSFLLRLMEIEYPADDSAKATINVEWDRSKWPSIYIPPPFQGPGGFKLGPRAIWRSRVTEVPYLMQDHKFVTQIATLAVKGDIHATGYRVWASFDAGQTYLLLDTTPGWSAFGRVNATFADTDHGFGFHLYGVGFDDIVVNQTPAEQADDTLLCFIDAEVMSVGRIIAYGNGFYTAGILRHRFGTAAASHAINADAYFVRRSDLRLIDNANFIPGNLVKFKLQPFTHESDYDLTTVPAVDYTIVGFDDIDPPDLSPNGGAFVDSVVVHDVNVPAGMTDRYTTDGTSVNGQHARFPVNAGLTLTASTTLRVRRFASNGRYSAERVVTFTRTTELPGGAQCSPPSRSFSGIQGYSAGNLTLSVVTTGSTIKFKKNGGATQNYSSAIALICDVGGDDVEYWATKAGMQDSAHVDFDNTRIEPGGGGHNRPPIIP